MTTTTWLVLLVGPLAAYVIGSTPFGVIIARAHGIDLRAAGSGNVGATNVGRVVGRRWGYVCFVLDVAKGLVPTAVAGWLLRRDGVPTTVDQLTWLAVALAAVAGHVLSFWLKFRGGKGVATSLGVVLGFWPYFTLPGLMALGLWIAVTLRWRYVSLGSIVAAGAFPILFVATALVVGWPLAEMLILAAFAVAVAGLIVYRHRGNIARLRAGTENAIGRRGRADSADRS